MIAALAVALAFFYVLPAGAEQLTGKVIRVADGDTLTIRTAQPLDYRIRISGIDGPEKGQPFGNRSKQTLVQLALNKQAQLDCYKTDQYRRKVCRVFVDGRDVGLEQVRVGMAWWYRKYAKEQSPEERGRYEIAERESRTKGMGLWDIEELPRRYFESRRQGLYRVQRRVGPPSLDPAHIGPGEPAAVRKGFWASPEFPDTTLSLV